LKILLIEGDNATARSIELMLKSESFNVYTTDLVEEGVDLGRLYDYDILLLDLSQQDSLEVLRSLRVSKVKTPILILGGVAAKFRGLGFEAENFITKPFHKDELIARIHAIVRRSKGRARSVIQIGDLVVNLDTKTVEVSGTRVHLLGKEYQTLELLALRKGTTLTKEMFLNHLYGGVDEPGLKVVDVFICKLRKKLANASGGKNYIETVYGRGYVLRDPMPPVDAEQTRRIAGTAGSIPQNVRAEFDDVTSALQKLMRSVPDDDEKHPKGRAIAYEILAIYGRGVKSVRELKPEFYCDVIRGCTIEAERVKLKAEFKPLTLAERNAIREQNFTNREAAIGKVVGAFAVIEFTHGGLCGDALHDKTVIADLNVALRDLQAAPRVDDCMYVTG
jgi:two-component system cell cycle response regulator CtrA